MIDLSPAAPQRHEWLTIHPLLSPDAAALGCDLLFDAIGAGTLSITEVGAGSVPELLATNDGDRDVLILDGEQFIGARQNRMASRSILLPARSRTKIPVNCMERGRWHGHRPDFDPSPYHSPSSVRSHNRRSESRLATAGLKATPEVLREAQGQVWNEIEALSRDVGERSETAALDDVIGRKARDIAAWLAGFPAVAGQIGILAFVGAEPLGLDVVGDPDLYARLHTRLVGGYVQDALRAIGAGDPDHEAARTYLGRVAKANRVDAPTVGHGTYRVLTGDLTGGELDDGGRTVHLSAFPLAVESGGDVYPTFPEGPRLAPPSRRRLR